MSKPKADFNFLYGVFKSRERELLDDTKIESLLSAHSLEDAIAGLPESPFSSEVSKNASEDGIDSAIDIETQIIRDFLNLNSPSKELTLLVYLPWDYFNLKVAILSKLREKENDQLFGPEGFISVENLKSYTEEMDFIMLPQDIYDSLQEAWIAYYEEDKNTQAFEFALDRQKNIHLTRIAQESDSQELLSFIKEGIEIKTAELLIRSKRAELPWKIVRWGIKEYPGYLKWEEMYGNDPAEWINYLEGLRDAPFRRILDRFSRNEDIGDIIRDEKDKLGEVLEGWKFKSPSIEYAYYFLSKKLANVYNMRMILLAKLKQLDNELIRKRIINVYL